jgi:hypothetical protein
MLTEPGSGIAAGSQGTDLELSGGQSRVTAEKAKDLAARIATRSRHGNPHCRHAIIMHNSAN